MQKEIKLHKEQKAKDFDQDDKNNKAIMNEVTSLISQFGYESIGCGKHRVIGSNFVNFQLFFTPFFLFIDGWEMTQMIFKCIIKPSC